MLALTLALIALAGPPDAPPINAVIGDQSWTAPTPPAHAPEATRIRAHLDHVAAALAAAPTDHLTPTQRRRRARALAHLATYAARGRYPRRAPHDGHGPRRPRFIDDRGVPCAVAALIRHSGHPALAHALNARHQYAYITDIDDPALAAWARTHGFTARELATIQPAYGWAAGPAVLDDIIEEHRDALTLRCQGTPPDALDLHFRVSRTQGCRSHRRYIEVTAPDAPPDPFTRCFVRGLQHQLHWHNGLGMRFDRPRVPIPPTFDRTTRYTFPPRGEVIARHLRATNLDPRVTPCWRRGPTRVHGVRAHVTPAPGATYAITVDTTPANPRAARCFTRIIERRLTHAGPAPAELDVTLAYGRPIDPPDLALTLTDAQHRHLTRCLDAAHAPVDRDLRRRIRLDRATPLAYTARPGHPLAAHTGSDALAACLTDAATAPHYAAPLRAALRAAALPARLAPPARPIRLTLRLAPEGHPDPSPTPAPRSPRRCPPAPAP